MSNVGSGVPDEHLILTPTEYTLTGVYLLLVGSLAILGNCFVIAVLIRSKNIFRPPLDKFLLCIAVADLLVSLTSYPFSAVSGFAGKWVFGHFGCVFNGLTSYFFTLISIDTLVAVAVSRYILICKIKYVRWLDNGNSNYILCVIVVHATMWSLPPLLGWNKYSYEPFQTSCSLYWTVQTWSEKSFVLFSILTSYCIQVSVILFCYTHLIQRIRSVTNESNSAATHGSHGTIKVSIAVVVTFLTLWTPYALRSLVSLAYPVTGWLSILPTMIAKLSCVCNPIIYTMANTKFKKELEKMLRMKFKCKRRVRRNMALTSQPSAILHV